MEDAVRKRAETVMRDREEVDEEQMEQFFAIVRRLRDALAAAGRIRARPDLEKEEGVGRTKKRMRSEKTSGSSSSWLPKFEREDFETEVEFAGRSLGGSRIPATIGNGRADQEKKKKKKMMKKAEDEEEEDKCKLKLLDDHLDLKLAL